MPLYTLIPQDVLFFRDGRPIEAAGGHGARWPEPSLVFDALHAALHRAFSEARRQDWEHCHDFGRSSHRPHQGDGSQRFGPLQTAGLFPVLENGEWLLPAPQDFVPLNEGELQLLHPLKDPAGRGNLPLPLRYPLANPCEPSKDEAKPW